MHAIYEKSTECYTALRHLEMLPQSSQQQTQQIQMEMNLGKVVKTLCRNQQNFPEGYYDPNKMKRYPVFMNWKV